MVSFKLSVFTERRTPAASLGRFRFDWSLDSWKQPPIRPISCDHACPRQLFLALFINLYLDPRRPLWICQKQDRCVNETLQMSAPSYRTVKVMRWDFLFDLRVRSNGEKKEVEAASKQLDSTRRDTCSVRVSPLVVLSPLAASVLQLEAAEQEEERDRFLF